MPSVGMKEKCFMLQGQPIRVEGDACVSADGTLAGSTLTMDRALRNLVAEGRKACAEGRSVIIYPEGTRVPHGERPPPRRSHGG